MYKDKQNKPHDVPWSTEWITKLCQIMDEATSLRDLLSNKIAKSGNGIHGVLKFDNINIKDQLYGFEPNKSLKKRSSITNKNAHKINECLMQILDLKYAKVFCETDTIIKTIDADIIKQISQQTKFDENLVRFIIERTWETQDYTFDDNDNQFDDNDDEDDTDRPKYRKSKQETKKQYIHAFTHTLRYYL